MNGIRLFTAAGCPRCSIAKRFMQERGIAYAEIDATGAGKEAFGQFYRLNRQAVHRGPDGIEFPVLADETSIRQGVGVVVAYLQAGRRLDGFIGRSEPSKGWVGGLHVSAGNPAQAGDLAEALGFLKRSGLKLELDTDGRNAAVLEMLLEAGLGDRVIMDLKGPKRLYAAILGAPVDPAEVGRSMHLATRFPEHRFVTTVAPVRRSEEDPDSIRYLTPAEIEETALWLKEATGSHRQPYFLRDFNLQHHPDDRMRRIAQLAPGNLLRHRSAARNYQVSTEIEAGPA